MSDSLNLRVSAALKQRVQAYGESLGLTDNAAAIVLLDRGLREFEAEQRAAGTASPEPEPAESPA